MKIVQAMPTLAYGDAIGNTALALDALLRGMGLRTGIYAENIDVRLPKGTARPAAKLRTEAEDILLYHGAVTSGFVEKLAKQPGRKVLIYHNITPPRFFDPYSAKSADLCAKGLEQMRFLAGKVERCIADSQFNADDLRRLGYTCPVDVCPVFIRFEDYRKPADEATLRALREDGRTNLLFVGRLAPNKKIEDVIRTFCLYKRRYNARARLILAGSDAVPNYTKRLHAYAQVLGAEDDIVFTGHISFAKLLACYRAADAFVCMSAHEGFCVPLLEAMVFDLPVVAAAHAAVPETLGGSGILLPEHSPALAAAAVDRVLRDDSLRAAVLAGQRARLRDFSTENVAARWQKIFRRLTGGERG